MEDGEEFEFGFHDSFGLVNSHGGIRAVIEPPLIGERRVLGVQS